MQEVTDVLRRMKEELLARGWCQHRIYNPGGSVCLVGALNLSVYGTVVIPEGKSDQRLPTYQALRAALDETGVSSLLKLHLWNDQPERTKAEVIALIDRALARVAEPASEPVLVST